MATVLVYLVYRRYPRSWVKYINVPVFFNAAGKFSFPTGLASDNDEAFQAISLPPTLVSLSSRKLHSIFADWCHQPNILFGSFSVSFSTTSSENGPLLGGSDTTVSSTPSLCFLPTLMQFSFTRPNPSCHGYWYGTRHHHHLLHS